MISAGEMPAGSPCRSGSAPSSQLVCAGRLKGRSITKLASTIQAENFTRPINLSPLILGRSRPDNLLRQAEANLYEAYWPHNWKEFRLAYFGGGTMRQVRLILTGIAI